MILILLRAGLKGSTSFIICLSFWERIFGEIWSSGIIVCSAAKLIHVVFCFLQLLLNFFQGNLPEFTRPWQNPVPPLTEAVEKKLLYPADEEGHGLVYIAFRGPSAKVDSFLLSLFEFWKWWLSFFLQEKMNHYFKNNNCKLWNYCMHLFCNHWCLIRREINWQNLRKYFIPRLLWRSEIWVFSSFIHT